MVCPNWNEGHLAKRDARVYPVDFLNGPDSR